jgi:hypothetical protein
MPRHIHPVPPILREKHFSDVSTFEPESLLRVAPVTTSLTDAAVPAVCVLDPDVHIVRQLRAAGRARKDEGWACYHTELYCAVEDGIALQVVRR